MPAVASLTVSMKLELWGRRLTPKSNLSPLRSMLPWSAPEPAKWNGSLGPFGSACMLAAAEALRFAWFCIACLLHWAASAVVGLLGREGAVIRMTLMPFVYYALLPGSIGYLILSYPTSGFANMGTVLVGAIVGLAVYIIARHGRAPAA